VTTRRQFMLAAGAGILAPTAWSLRSAVSQPPITVPLTLETTEIDLAGTIATTWGYNGKVPGPEIRLKEGETLRVPVRNNITEPTLVHWHGISLANKMDGTHLTQRVIEPGHSFEYEFVVPEAGTHWYHAHAGDQADRGLYGPLIVEPRVEQLSYDRDFTLVLDDWSDGVKPEEAAQSGTIGARVGGYGSARVQFDDAPVEEEVQRVTFGGRAYPFILVNARPAADPAVFDVRRGERIRLRIINAGADTGFRFAVAGHRMTVTHSDGMPVKPVVVDALRLGMGERYDVLIDANAPGLWQMGVLPEGKTGFGRAILRYLDAEASSVPAADFRPQELEHRLCTYDDLAGLAPPRTPASGAPDQVYSMHLHHTSIRIEGLDDDAPIVVSEGEWVRFHMRNESDHWHPMHLHGHHFNLRNSGRPLKDTVIIPARGGESTWDWRASNPGLWMLHCHNAYHHQDGMMREIHYAGLVPPTPHASAHGVHRKSATSQLHKH
jgi:multicopper oxidase